MRLESLGGDWKSNRRADVYFLRGSTVGDRRDTARVPFRGPPRDQRGDHRRGDSAVHLRRAGGVGDGEVERSRLHLKHHPRARSLHFGEERLPGVGG